MRAKKVACAVVAVVVAACHGDGGAAQEGDGCLACHGGIEQAHGPIDPGECVVCHGGDPEATDKAGAHVPVPDDWAEIRGDALPPANEGFVRDFSPGQLDALDRAYLRFVNPSDFRVVDETCGTCHPDKAETVPTSIMATNAGHYMPTLFLAGVQDDRIARWGSYPTLDYGCDVPDETRSCGLAPLEPPTGETLAAILQSGDDAAIEEAAYVHYLAKNCNHCHQSGFPRNDSPGLFRSTGCASCHVVYDTFGAYEGGDPTIPRGVPVHPKRHEITAAIPVSQCTTCHYQGGRIGLLFQGIREGGFSPSNTPEHAVPYPHTIFGHATGYYFVDEDDRNDVDETPPDVHAAAGMVCADCHVGSDVHGTGLLHPTAKVQLDLACEDCHGTVRAPAAPGPDGWFRTGKGRILPQLRTDEDGSVYLVGKVSGVRHDVPQPARLLAPGGGASEAMRTAMAPDGTGWSHTDSLTCDTCHTSYNQYCIGCHVSVDFRLSQQDRQTGHASPGLTRGGRTTYTLEHVLLGRAPDGRIQTVHPSQQVQLAVVGSAALGTGDGEVLLGEAVEQPDGSTKLVGEFRHGGGHEANNGFVPFFQHTTSRKPRACDACHPRDDSPEETARVRGVYGFGTGEFVLAGPGGQQVDGLAFLNADGTPATEWVHAGTGPASAETIARALSVLVGP